MSNNEQPEKSKKTILDKVETGAKSEGHSIAYKVPAISKTDSDSLVTQSKKHLDPALGFPNPKIESTIAPGIVASAPVASDKTPTPTSAKLKKDWVVTLDLTVHLGTDTADAQRKRLEALAEGTKGKSVALVVQDVEPNGQRKSGEPEEQRQPGQPKQPKQPKQPIQTRQPGQLHRYMIADGVVKELPTEESKGFAADAASLVTKAKELVQGKKTAFIELGHGNGNTGFMGEDGQSQVKELADALKSANGGPMNDIVLDSCLVAQDGAIKALAAAAKDDVVATAELGGNADDSVRALNYEKTLSKLIGDPSMDGKALARQFVEDGKAGANIYPDSKGKPEAGIQDLTAFDPSKVDGFEEKLGKFGDALKGAEANPDNRAVLQKLISAAHRYDIAFKFDQKRDLSTFARSVQDAIEKGSLKDPTHQLADSTKQILVAQKDMTDATYGQGNLDGLGGLSVFLPSSDHTHHRDSKNPSLMDMVRNTVKGAVDNKQTDDQTQDHLSKQVGLLEDAIGDHPELADEMRKLKSTAKSLASGSSDEERVKSFRDFQNTLKELENDTAFMKALTQRMSNGDRYDLAISGNAGWSNFINSLYSDEMYTA